MTMRQHMLPPPPLIIVKKATICLTLVPSIIVMTW
jgi:hypothetical protein